MVLVALCLTVVLGVAIAGFVALCARSMELSNRSFCYSSCGHLAENGLEEAMWALGKARNGGYTWPGWTLTTVGGVPTATKQITGFTINRGIPGTVDIEIDYFNTTAPYSQPAIITAVGSAQMPDGAAISKRLRVSTKPAALFANAAGAYNTITFTINYTDTLDSYDSSIDPNPASPSQTVKDQALVSAPSVSVNNASIMGYVATTGSAPVYLSHGGVVGSTTPSGVTVDNSRIFTNARQPAFDITAPTGAGSVLFGGATSGTTTIGVAGSSTPSIYFDGASGVDLAGSDTLTIDGPVILVIAHDFRIQDSASVVITTNGSAQIVVAGYINVAGNGINNLTRLPKNLALFGSKASSGYDYAGVLATPVPFYGVLYVPNGSLQIYGNTTIYGAVAANVINMGWGTGVLHYDVNLRQTVFSAISTPNDVAQWLAN